MQPLTMPDDEAAWLPWLEERAGGQLRLAGEQVLALRTAPHGDAVVLELWNDVGIAIGNAAAAAAVLQQVHPDPTVMTRAEELDVEVQRFVSDLHLDTEVYARLASVPTEGLDEGGRRVLDKALLAFRRAGADRPDDVRDRVRELDRRLTDLGQAFSRHIRDGLRTTTVPASALEGLPADYVADHPATDGTVEISTAYPDTRPFLAFSHDAAARRAVATTFHNLAWPENEAVLVELLGLRHERATMLGYADWPDYDAEVKMIGSGPAIAAFVDDVADRAEDAGRRELAELAARAHEDGLDAVDWSAWQYYVMALQRERFGVDAQEVRRYLDFTKVHDGLLDVTGRLLGLVYERVDAPSWHPDVTSYDVRRAGHLLGRIHLDLHPRERKFNHAAMFALVPGVRDRQLAEGVLVCNLSRGLMEHREVVTLFHEFGHLVHHVLAGRQDWARFSGTATEWDFVEAPSQLLEEWAWHPEVLGGFATDADGTPIPADLVGRMRAAEEFGKAVHVRQQMYYAALSYRLHLERPDDPGALSAELWRRYNLLDPVPDTHFYAGFGHLEGYTSAYYTYQWSLVIAKDLVSAFDLDDPFAPEVAGRYRDRVLAPGGSRDAADLVADFLGRPYTTDAFEAWLRR